MAGLTGSESAGVGAPLRVLRISHSAVVTAWRQRERELRMSEVDLTLLSAAQWEEGGSLVRFDPAGDDFARAVRTFGRHPNRFVYDPRPLWRELGSKWDLVDLHEEPFGLAVAEVLVLRWLRRRRVPFVVYSAQNLYKRYPPPFRWLERWSLRRAAGAYTCNEDAARILRRKGLDAPAVVIPLGIDIDRYEPAVRAAPGETLKVGFVGRLIPHKGADVLLRAVALDDRLSAEIVGSGPDSARLADLVHELGLAARVSLCGHVDEEETPAVYRRFDALAVPSVPTPGWVEQFGRVVVEAQASGVPVVASRSGALPEVVGDAGILVEPGDPVALCRGLVRLLDEPGRWAEARAGGLAASTRCSWSRVAADQLRLYRSAVTSG
ncbi:MAG TPA: glycosyltransferase [Acidimicrobiales bacterium]|nr:glycosyltransferase [Acidimicrobiales bacterium]